MSTGINGFWRFFISFIDMPSVEVDVDGLSCLIASATWALPTGWKAREHIFVFH